MANQEVINKVNEIISLTPEELTYMVREELLNSDRFFKEEARIKAIAELENSSIIEIHNITIGSKSFQNENQIKVEIWYLPEGKPIFSSTKITLSA